MQDHEQFGSVWISTFTTSYMCGSQDQRCPTHQVSSKDTTAGPLSIVPPPLFTLRVNEDRDGLGTTMDPTCRQGLINTNDWYGQVKASRRPILLGRSDNLDTMLICHDSLHMVLIVHHGKPKLRLQRPTKRRQKRATARTTRTGIEENKGQQEEHKAGQEPWRRVKVACLKQGHQLYNDGPSTWDPALSLGEQTRKLGNMLISLGTSLKP